MDLDRARRNKQRPALDRSVSDLPDRSLKETITHHSHNSDAWMIQNAIQQEQAQINFWGWVTAANQWQTNRRLEQSNEALQENNRLLEQIRRQLLTPAERAAEDAQRRAAKVARLKKEAEDRKINTRIGLALVIGVALVCFLSWENSMTAEAAAKEKQVQQTTVQYTEPVAPEPTPAQPQIEPTPPLVTVVNREPPVRRAQLVRSHHRQR